MQLRAYGARVVAPSPQKMICTLHHSRGEDTSILLCSFYLLHSWRVCRRLAEWLHSPCTAHPIQSDRAIGFRAGIGLPLHLLRPLVSHWFVTRMSEAAASSSNRIQQTQVQSELCGLGPAPETQNRASNCLLQTLRCEKRQAIITIVLSPVLLLLEIFRQKQKCQSSCVPFLGQYGERFSKFAINSSQYIFRQALAWPNAICNVQITGLHLP